METPPQILNVAIDDLIVDDGFNCRGRFSPLDVVELAKDIERQGLIQPVVITPVADGKWKLVAGFRRLWAHRVLKKTHINAVVRPSMTDNDARILNLTENLQRKSLNIMQEAKAIMPLIANGMTEDEIAKRLGCGRGWVQPRKMLLSLPQEVQLACAAGLFNQGHIRELYMMTEEDQAKAVRAAKDQAYRSEKVTVRKPVNNNIKAKFARKRGEIFDMMFHIQKSLGNGAWTRAMAWCSGQISTQDLEETLHEEAAKLGKRYITVQQAETLLP